MDSWLKAFVAVADERGFGRAAGRLYITQPALTKQIKALEERLGARLFTRGRQGAVLTEFGEALLPRARELVDGTGDFLHRARRLASGEVGRLRLGFGLSTIELAPRAVAAFRRRYPEVDISLEDMPSDVQVDRVRAGELHAAFVRLPAGDLAALTLRRDRLAVASAGPVPETNRPRGLAEWVEDQGLIRLARPKGPGLWDQVESLLAAWRIRPRTIQEAHDLQTVLALVAAGVGPALVPSSARVIAAPDVRLVPVEDEATAWDVGVVWRGDRDDPALGNFLAMVRAELSKNDEW